MAKRQVPARVAAQNERKRSNAAGPHKGLNLNRSEMERRAVRDQELPVAVKLKLSKDAVEAIGKLSSLLNDEHQELSEYFDERSERWRESDKGMAAEAWLEEIENLISELDNLAEEPES